MLFFINFFGKAIAKFEAVKKNILLIFLFFINFHLFANPEIDSLISLRNKILKTGELSQIERLNNDFIQQLDAFLVNNLQHFKTLQSLPKVGFLQAKNQQVFILNWNIPLAYGEYKYFGYIFYKDGKNWQKIKLFDNSEKALNPELKSYSPDNWFGALYYEIIDVKFKQETLYILLGWDGNNQYTNKKIIDVFWFDDNKPKFGKPIFETPNGMANRVIFEYSKEATMSLKYDSKNKLIVFDHLAPYQPGAEGIYEFYGPDLSYDAYQILKTKLIFTPTVDVRLPSSNKNYIDPRDFVPNINNK